MAESYYYSNVAQAHGVIWGGRKGLYFFSPPEIIS